MFSFWLRVFWEALEQSFLTIGKEPSDLAVSVLVFFLVGCFLIRRKGKIEGFKEAMKRLPRALGEDFAILAGVFFFILIYHMGKGAYLEWKEKDDEVEKVKLQIQSDKPKFEPKLTLMGTAPAGNKDQDSMVLLMGYIVNRGASGGVAEFSVALEIDSTTITGEFSLPPRENEKVTFGKTSQHEAVYLLGETNWMRTARTHPIPPNVPVDGWLILVFRGITNKEIYAKKGTFVLTCTDTNGIKSSARIQATENQVLKKGFLGLDKIQHH